MWGDLPGQEPSETHSFRLAWFTAASMLGTIRLVGSPGELQRNEPDGDHSKGGNYSKPKDTVSE